MKHIILFSFISLLLFGCRELVQDDKSIRSIEDFDYGKVKTYLLDELQSDYKNPALYFRLGVNYKNQNLLPEAIINIEKAIEITPENEEFYKTLIPLLIEIEDWKSTEHYSDLLIDLSPSFYHAYYYLVRSCVNQNKMDKAGESLRILSQINAGYPNLPYLKGRYYLAKKDTLDAIYTFEQSINKGQQVNKLVFMLTSIYLEKGQQEKAQQLLTTHANNPELDQVQLNILQGKLAEKSKDKTKAKYHYRKVFDYGNDCLTAYKLVDLYLSKWKTDSAQYYFNKTDNCEKTETIIFITHG